MMIGRGSPSVTPCVLGFPRLVVVVNLVGQICTVFPGPSATTTGILGRGRLSATYCVTWVPSFPGFFLIMLI